MDETLNYFENKETGRRIAPEAIDCKQIINYPIYQGKKLLGRCLVLVTDIHRVVLDVVVYNERDRKKGVAKEVLQFACMDNKVLVSSTFSKVGKKLALSAGFGRLKDNPDIYIFKEADNVTQKGASNGSNTKR